MVFSWTLLIVAGAVIVSMVVLLMVCLDCRNKGPLVSIRQVNTSEYMPSNEFRIIHPSQPTTDLNSTVHAAANSLSPFLLPSDRGTRRHRSFTAAETESNQSYENPTDGMDNPESNAGDYLIVLPPSRASTPSSDVQHDYENVRVSSEETDYLNVKPESDSCHSFPQRESPAMDELYPVTSSDNDNNEGDDDDDEDDEAGNYVNVTPHMTDFFTSMAFNETAERPTQENQD